VKFSEDYSVLTTGNNVSKLLVMGKLQMNARVNLLNRAQMLTFAGTGLVISTSRPTIDRCILHEFCQQASFSV
jgi:hypothetical protein